VKWFEYQAEKKVRKFAFGDAEPGCTSFAFPPASTAVRGIVSEPSVAAASPDGSPVPAEGRAAATGIHAPLQAARASGALPAVDAAANLDIEAVMQRDDVAAAVEERVAARADERWNELIARVVEERQRALRSASTQVALVARAVARTLVGDAMSQDPDVIVGIAERALREAAGLGTATLFVHPNAVASIAAVLNEHGGSSEAGVRVHSDDTLAYGDCRVETPRGHVESDQEEQVFALVQQAFGAVRRSKASKQTNVEEAS
jgi:flagellar assembly protein FliH